MKRLLFLLFLLLSTVSHADITTRHENTRPYLISVFSYENYIYRDIYEVTVGSEVDSSEVVYSSYDYYMNIDKLKAKIMEAKESRRLLNVRINDNGWGTESSLWLEFADLNRR